MSCRNCAELLRRIADLEKQNLDLVKGRIKKAVEEGTVVYAPTTVVDYLETEVQSVLKEHGIEAMFVSDQTSLSDFDLDDKRLLWQAAIDWLRQRAKVHES